MELNYEELNKHYLQLAFKVAQQSNDPSSRMGAIIVTPNLYLEAGRGHNGFPPGIKEDDRMRDRAIKYEYVVHAEMRAIINAKRLNLSKCIIFVTDIPCCRCAAHIIEAGIKKVVTTNAVTDYQRRWADSVQRTRNLFEEAGVELVEISL